MSTLTLASPAPKGQEPPIVLKGGATSVNLVGVHDSGAPSSLVDGVILNASILNGLRVQDAGPVITSIVDDGFKTTVITGFASGNLNTANGYISQPGFVWPQQLMGDFEIIARVGGVGSSARQVALAAFSGDVVGQAAGNSLVRGAWSTTQGTDTAYALADTGSINQQKAATPWTPATWLRLRTVADEVIYETGGTSFGPSWVILKQARWGRLGSAFYAGLLWHAGASSGDTLLIYDFSLVGSEYTATP